MKRAILVVEDNWQDRALLSLMLESAGFPMIHASNGTEAKCVYRRHRSKIAMVIMGDLGVDPCGSFTELIRQLNPSLPMFAKSAEPWTSAERFRQLPLRLRPLSLMIRISRAFESAVGLKSSKNEQMPYHRFRIEPTAF